MRKVYHDVPQAMALQGAYLYEDLFSLAQQKKVREGDMVVQGDVGDLLRSCSTTFGSAGAKAVSKELDKAGSDRRLTLTAAEAMGLKLALSKLMPR